MTAAENTTNPTAPDLEKLAGVFKTAWQAADARGEAGRRVIAGLRAVLAHPAMRDLLADTARAAALRASEADQCVCPPDFCLGVPGDSVECQACLALDVEEGCIRERASEADR